MFIMIVTSLVIIIGVLLWRRYSRLFYFGSKIPGPPALPIIGNGLLFVNKTPSEMLFALMDGMVKYPGVTRFWIGPHLFVYLTDPKHVEALVTDINIIEKSVEYSTMKPWLNEGLLLSNGIKWHKRRKIITPTFHFKILEQFVEVFNRQSDILLETLVQFKSSDKVELYPIVALFTLDVICETAMGTCVNAQKQSDSEYVGAVREIANILHLRMFNFILKNNFLFNLSKYAKIQKNALQVLHGFTDRIIKQRRIEVVTSNNLPTDNLPNEFGVKRKMAFLDMLLQSTIDGQPLSDLDIREEVDTFMFEGHDTTTSAITFVLYNLAKYPDIQQKCFEEIIHCCGDDTKKSMQLIDLNRLTYLEKVLKESLRIYPSVPLIARQIRNDVTLNGITYPAGCSLGVSMINMGRDPNIFQNSEKFLPERFDNDAYSEKTHIFAYLPFSAGPRNCIGQKFAMLEMKSVIAKILSKFQLNLNSDSMDEPEIMAELVLKPVSKINFHLTQRV